ncbi:MAG TPA: YidC/Oxa1 family insertase periplasmic-domain containing protein, partial [Gemmataceae bacterium]|nr:YidC/Oxa1 family insertase periplasmic-domain containing protein [Gemmataceae bacterium]
QEPPAAGEQAKEPPKQPTPAMVVAGLVGQAAAPGLDAPIRAETAARVAVRSWPGLASRPQPVAKKPEPKPEAPKLPPQPLVTLGKDTDFVTAVIDPNRGAGVVRLTLPDFQAADSLGRPEWEDAAHKVKKPLDLLPAELNHDVPSFLLLDCEQGKDDQVRPYARLGEQPWQEDRSLRQTDPDGTVRRVAFWTDVQDVRITKVYTLEPGDYHLGMEVRVARAPGVSPDKEVFFRYHLTSGHGLPIEGEWYTYTQRNAVVGLVDDKGNAERSLQYLQSIARMDGGNDVPGEGKGIQYGGVVTQYFASLVVVDGNPNTEGVFLRARPTVEARALKGTIQELPGGDTVRLLNKHDNKVYTVRLTPETILGGDLKAGEPVNVLAWSDPHDTLVARQLFAGQDADQLMFKATGHMLMFDDITVHMVTDRLDLKPGAGPLVQKYLLYNGPAKVQLLAYLEGSRKVAPALVERYSDKLHLNTVTDFHDPSTIGEIFYHTGGTWLVITITNLMHFILWVLHTYVMPWSWGLCILLLTVMVRGVMFPLSRKQALMSVRMQQLQPEIQKLKEKYKEDRQGLGLAQMELYRRHGVSPMGSCWTMFIQLPIFMGLYYALQQSILFRLAPFVWIPSLSAPDMLVNWGISIPVISDPAWREGSLLSFFYLGPFLNVLPVIVAGFMYVQQKLFTPPPADEQQEAQQKMMGFMTVIFGLMFYKLASGLCLYYIASSLWSLAERKFLPRRKPDENAPPPPARAGLMQRAMERLTALA